MLSMTDGKELAPFRYEDLKYKENGMIAYKEDGRWGLMDTAGTPLTEPLYKSIGNAENNRIPAKAKDGWLYLDYAGKKQLPLKRMRKMSPRSEKEEPASRQTVNGD